MDLEKESTMIKVDTGKSQELSELCTRLLELQKQITKCEDNIKNLRNEERLLSENEIPNLMQQSGISSLNDPSRILMFLLKSLNSIVTL